MRALTQLQVRGVAGALGAEITGVDLGALSDAAFVEIQRVTDPSYAS